MTEEQGTARERLEGAFNFMQRTEDWHPKVQGARVLDYVLDNLLLVLEAAQEEGQAEEMVGRFVFDVDDDRKPHGHTEHGWRLLSDSEPPKP